MATSAKEADKFKCWKDFSGKPVYFTQAGFQNWLNWQRIFKTLGYDFKHVQIDNKANGDALEQGTIVGSAIYTTAGRSLAPLEGDRGAHGHQGHQPMSDGRQLKATVRDLEVGKGAFIRASGPRCCRACRPVRLQRSFDAGGRRLQDGQGSTKRDELVKLDPGFTPVAGFVMQVRASTPVANPSACGPCQVPEGAQGLERQVEGRPRRVLIVRLQEMGGHYRERVPAPKSLAQGRTSAPIRQSETRCAAIDLGSALDSGGQSPPSGGIACRAQRLGRMPRSTI